MPIIRSQQGSQFEDGRYSEIMEALRRSRRRGDFETGMLLAQLFEEKDYGPWSSFKDCVVGELKITERSAYRLIAGFRICVMLKEHDCRLPVNERQVRPLSSLKEDHQRVTAWTRACDLKQRSLPSHADVQREVNKIRRSLQGRDENADKAYWAYRELLQSAQADLNRATKFLAEGDMEPFLLCTDETSLRRLKVIRQSVLRMGVQLGDHLKKLTGTGDIEDEGD